MSFSAFEKLNHRLAQIVLELETIEDELKGLMKARLVAPKRIYWALRVQFTKDKDRTPIYFWATFSGKVDAAMDKRTEMSKAEAKLMKPKVIEHCKTRFGHGFEVKTVKVTVYPKTV